METNGQYFKSFITNTPADISSAEYMQFKKTIPKFPQEAIFIYSFPKQRMIYANGWEEILGYRDDEINMQTIVEITTTEYAPFSNELNDKAFMVIQTKTERLEEYSFMIELKKFHKNGMPVPIIMKVGVFRSVNGKVTETIGRCQINRSINMGKVMRYAAYGPEKGDFEDILNRNLFNYYAISEKEKDALSLAAKGYSFKQIASHFHVSQSAIEKRIIPLYKKFEVASLPHLISFAYDNFILP